MDFDERSKSVLDPGNETRPPITRERSLTRFMGLCFEGVRIGVFVFWKQGRDRDPEYLFLSGVYLIHWSLCAREWMPTLKCKMLLSVLIRETILVNTHVFS
jgi:hypothetical protein